MALTCTLIEAGNDVTSTAIVATGSHTPGANKLQRLRVYTADFTAPSAPTVTGCGLTWVQMATPQAIPGNANITEFRAMGPSPTTGVLTIDTHGGNPACCYWSWAEWDGTDISGTNGSGAIRQCVPGVANGTGLSITLAALLPGSASEGSFANRSGDPTTFGAGYTELSDQSGASGVSSGLQTQYKIAGSTTVDCSGLSGGTDVGGFAVEILPPQAPIEQEGYRFRNDDGSETTATWQASQDTNVTHPLATNLRLRTLLNATGDPPTNAFTLQWKRTTGAVWRDVPVSAAGSCALTWGAVGAVAFSTASGTSVAPAYPSGITTKSALILIVGQKPTTANGGTCTQPTGWTLIGSKASGGGYGATLGADTGNTNLYVYAKDEVDGTEGGNLTVTVGDNNVCWSYIQRLQSDVDPTWAYALVSGDDTAAGNVSIAMGSDPGVAAGDYILGAMCIPTDVTTPAQFSASALSQSGITFGTVTEVAEPDSTTGNDIGGLLIEAPVTAGTSGGVPTMTATAGGTTTNVRGPGIFLRIRATPNQPIVMSASANITAGGEATTAQLAAPSGKSTSDFVTGRMWDNENGTDSIDLTTDDYTELERCVIAQSPAANGHIYQLRETNGVTVYTGTPEWTIGTPGGGGGGGKPALYYMNQNRR